MSEYPPRPFLFPRTEKGKIAMTIFLMLVGFIVLILIWLAMPNKTNKTSKLSEISIPQNYKQCPACSLIVRQIGYSLETSPKEWKTDGFRLTHDSGTCIWVANGAYGIGIGPNEWTSETNQLNDDAARKYLWGIYQQWIINPERYK